MTLFIELNRLKTSRSLVNIIFFCSCLIFSNKLQSIIFIDIDEFDFRNAVQKSGLRICEFDTVGQKYNKISYYNFPPTSKRKPTGDLLVNYYGLNIDYNGNVRFSSFLENTIVRTKGTIEGEKNGVYIKKDDEDKNIAYKSLSILSGADLKNTLNRFEKGQYGKNDINISFLNYPSWSGQYVTLGQISQDDQENNNERKIIGELATRMAFFSYGYLDSVVTR
ncbi:MAG: hypothetical protein H0X26_08875 [Alphaproteobacteria bacterium]|nr:hypothetical protein [Alphaproteobacteria bacterium]